MVLEDLNGEKIVGMLYGKELQKRNEFRTEKVREKTINYMSNGKDMIILLAVGLIKKILLYETIYFKQKQKKVELYLSNYATKSDLLSVTGNDALYELEKVPNDLNSLKSKVDKQDVDKLKSAPVYLIKY